MRDHYECLLTWVKSPDSVNQPYFLDVTDPILIYTPDPKYETACEQHLTWPWLSCYQGHIITVSFSGRIFIIYKYSPCLLNFLIELNSYQKSHKIFTSHILSLNTFIWCHCFYDFLVILNLVMFAVSCWWKTHWSQWTQMSSTQYFTCLI